MSGYSFMSRVSIAHPTLLAEDMEGLVEEYYARLSRFFFYRGLIIHLFTLTPEGEGKQ